MGRDEDTVNADHISKDITVDDNWQRAIVRIETPEGTRTLGTGFAIDRHHILTCAHVVKPATSPTVRFSRARISDSYTTTTAHHDIHRDVAILRLETPLPDSIEPLPLGLNAASVGHPFSTFGYAEGFVATGKPGNGIVVGTDEAGELHLRSQEFDKGMSGAPIWDISLGWVIGMVRAVTKANIGPSRDTALAISTQTIRQSWQGFPFEQLNDTASSSVFVETDVTIDEMALMQIDALLQEMLEEKGVQVETDATYFSEEQAKELLRVIYRTYHDRDVDELGMRSWLPHIMERGFQGLIYVHAQVARSDEHNKRIHEELRTFWQQRFGRRPTEKEVEKYKRDVRFYRRRALEVLEEKADLADDLLRQARAQLNEQLPSAAETLLLRAIDEGIPSWEAWHTLGLAQYRQRKFEAATQSYQQAILQNQVDDQWLWSCEDLKLCYEALTKRDNSWMTAAITFFKSVTEKMPRRWIAWHELAWFTWQSGNPEDAIPHYKQVLRLKNDRTWGWSSDNLKQCFNSTGRLQEATDFFITVTEQDAADWGSWHSRGWLEWKHQGDFPSAISSYRKAIAMRSEWASGWFWSHYDLGWCHYEYKQYDAAFDQFRHAADKAPENWGPWHGMGTSKEMAGEFADAIPCYVEAVRLNGQSEWSWVGLGRCLSEVGRFLNAYEAYMGFFALRVNNPGATDAAQQGVKQLGNAWKVELRRVMSRQMEPDELEALCWDLGVPIKEIAGQTHSQRVMSLLTKMENEERVVEMLGVLRELRPTLLPSLVDY